MTDPLQLLAEVEAKMRRRDFLGNLPDSEARRLNMLSLADAVPDLAGAIRAALAERDAGAVAVREACADLFNADTSNAAIRTWLSFKGMAEARKAIGAIAIPTPALDGVLEKARTQERERCVDACHGVAFKGTRGNESTVVHVVNECARAIRALPANTNGV